MRLLLQRASISIRTTAITATVRSCCQGTALLLVVAVVVRRELSHGVCTCIWAIAERSPARLCDQRVPTFARHRIRPSLPTWSVHLHLSLTGSGVVCSRACWRMGASLCISRMESSSWPADCICGALLVSFSFWFMGTCLCIATSTQSTNVGRLMGMETMGTSSAMQPD